MKKAQLSSLLLHEMFDALIGEPIKVGAINEMVYLYRGHH